MIGTWNCCSEFKGGDRMHSIFPFYQTLLKISNPWLKMTKFPNSSLSRKFIRNKFSPFIMTLCGKWLLWWKKWIMRLLKGMFLGLLLLPHPMCKEFLQDLHPLVWKSKQVLTLPHPIKQLKMLPTITWLISLLTPAHGHIPCEKVSRLQRESTSLKLFFSAQATKSNQEHSRDNLDSAI